MRGAATRRAWLGIACVVCLGLVTGCGLQRNAARGKAPEDAPTAAPAAAPVTVNEPAAEGPARVDEAAPRPVEPASAEPAREDEAPAPPPAGQGAPSRSGPAPAAPEPIEVNVMSFNLRYGTAKDGANAWPARSDFVFDVIRARAPDSVGLQEALRFQIDEIRKALPGYGEIGVGRDGGTRGEYSAILYRADRFNAAESGTFWLSDTPEVPSRTWGNECIRICTWARLVEKGEGEDGAAGRAFYLFNTHLDHRSQPSREKAVRLVARRIASRAHPDPVLLTGDLNADERNSAVRYLLGAEADACPVRLVDTFRVLHPDERAAGTFHGFSGLAPGGKIDYVLAGAGAEVLEAEIVRESRDGRFPSDHYPVTARLRLPVAGER